MAIHFPFWHLVPVIQETAAHGLYKTHFPTWHIVPEGHTIFLQASTQLLLRHFFPYAHYRSYAHYPIGLHCPLVHL